MNLEFSIIVCIEPNRGIGKGNTMPWHYAEDMENFKSHTIDNIVIMGRKTWDGLPAKFKPLAKRINVVITAHPQEIQGNLTISPEKMKDVKLVPDFNSALVEAKKYAKDKHIFVIGGASIFKIAINHPACRELIITELKNAFDCDAFFPEFRNKWTRIKTIFENENLRVNIYRRI